MIFILQEQDNLKTEIPLFKSTAQKYVGTDISFLDKMTDLFVIKCHFLTLLYQVNCDINKIMI